MLIRKRFTFEMAHLVRNCASQRCALSLHGHSYRIDLLLTASRLDQAGMIVDFGLLKGTIRDLIDSWDHAACFWDADDPDYIAALQRFSARWVALPVNPTAEQLSRVFFVLVDAALGVTRFANGETGVTLDGVILHETASAYAHCRREDILNPAMGGDIRPEAIRFSPAIRADWPDPDLWTRICAAHRHGTALFQHTPPPQQVRAPDRSPS